MSTILPLPSSPHCAPSTAMFITGYMVIRGFDETFGISPQPDNDMIDLDVFSLTLDRLIDLLTRGIHPRVPPRGSVGGRGDLAPVAHLALVWIGEGEAWGGGAGEAGGAGKDIESGAEALRRVGLAPVTLAPKEGL